MEDGEMRCDENQTEADGFAVCCVVLPLTRIELPLALGARLGDRAPGVCVCGPEMGTEPFAMPLSSGGMVPCPSRRACRGPKDSKRKKERGMELSSGSGATHVRRRVDGSRRAGRAAFPPLI